MFAEQNKNVTKETQLPMVLVSSQRGNTDEDGDVGDASVIQVTSKKSSVQTNVASHTRW